MRPLALVALLLVLPVASAQLGGVGSQMASLSVAPPHEAVRPLGGAVTVPVELRATCPPSTLLEPARVEYHVSMLPPWASATISPASDAFGHGRCVDGVVRLEAALTLATGADAPAFVPGPVEVSVRVSYPLGESASARATVPLHAGYFSILDVAAAETMKRPRGLLPVAFPIKVTNFGNADTRVRFHLDQAAEGLTVSPPDPVVLQSRQAGGSQIQAEVAAWATRKPGAVGDLPFTLRYVATYALDPNLIGDAGTISFIVDEAGQAAAHGETTLEESSVPDRVRELPLSPLAGLAALALAALLRRR